MPQATPSHVPSASSVLVRPARHPLRGPASVVRFGRTAVVAPHPDDESLGCGGALALLARHAVPALVLVVSDGTRSHPNSRRYPAPALRALRERETLEALGHLGLPDHAAVFLRLPDCGVPVPGEAGFEEALAACGAVLARFAPETLLVPWRRDPHCDHEAAWHLARGAARMLPRRPRWLEYPVWAWAYARAPLAPQRGEGRPWRLDIRPVRHRKQQAVRAHRSQTTGLIADDPEGFRLTPGMLRPFERAWELFLTFDAAAEAVPPCTRDARSE